MNNHKRLYRERCIEVCDVTYMQSTGRELLPTFLTKKAERLLAGDRTGQEV